MYQAKIKIFLSGTNHDEFDINETGDLLDCICLDEITIIETQPAEQNDEGDLG